MDAVALDEPDRGVEPLDEPADRVVELAQHAHQLLGLDGVDEAVHPRRSAKNIATWRRWLRRMDSSPEETIASAMRREEPSESLQSFELLELRAHLAPRACGSDRAARRPGP